MTVPCHIVHIVYRLDFGGMENGLVNLINRLAADRYLHTIICLTESTEFRRRIDRPDVDIVECQKPSGKHLPTYWRVFRELRRLRPDIVHTRNLGTIDLSWIARLARCPRRIHGEHGWSPDDPRGLSPKYRRLRRICDPVIERYVAVSDDICRWLTDVIGVAESKIRTLHNGVDLERFTSCGVGDSAGNVSTDKVVFGTLGRQEPIKGLDVLLVAIRDLLEREPAWRERVQVVMAGDGPDHRHYMELRDAYELRGVVDFPGSVTDVPALLQKFDFFVQPSLNEGISNTVLEAMATGLPIIATEVGGNPELVRDGREGTLVPAGDADSLRAAIAEYLANHEMRRRHGWAARERAVNNFSIEVMISEYDRLYSDNCPNLRASAA